MFLMLEILKNIKGHFKDSLLKVIFLKWVPLMVETPTKPSWWFQPIISQVGSFPQGSG